MLISMTGFCSLSHLIIIVLGFGSDFDDVIRPTIQVLVSDSSPSPVPVKEVAFKLSIVFL